MANYIGKISALVTASTADLERKLDGSVASVRKFGRSISSTITSASTSAERSLNSIFTPLQRIQRALDIGSRSRLQLIDDQQLRQAQQAVSVAEQLNKPLSAAAGSFQRLTAEVASQFLPALIRAQVAVERTNAEIATSGGVTQASFNVATKAIDETTAALNRLAQAQQIIASAPTGQDLQFQSPQLFAALQASADARRSAAAPGVAGRVGGDLGRAVAELTRYDNLLQQTEAELSRIRLSPRVDDRELEAAQGRLQEYLALQRRAREEVQRLSAPAATDPGRGFALVDAQRPQAGLGLFGSQVGSDADRAIARAKQLDAEFKKLPQSAQRGIGAIAGIASRVSDEVAKTGSGASQLSSVLDVLEGKINEAASAEARLAAEQKARLAVANSLLQVDQRESELLSRRGERTNIPAGRQGRTRVVEELGGEVGVLRRKLEELPAPLQAQLGPEVDRITNKFRALGRNGVAFTAQEAKKLAGEITTVNAALDSRRNRGQQFLQNFGGAGAAGLNVGIDARQLQGIAGQIDFLQNKLSRFSSQARGPAVAALQRYREVAAKVFSEGAQNTDKGRAAIDRASASVVRLSARLLGVRADKLAADLQRIGDVARGVGSKSGLAFQQLVFAVDDFFSVSGGLDQRLRAAGNNISQFGFIIGGTTGLILGVAASLAGQGVAALLKWSGTAVEAQDKAKALNEALKRQADLVSQLQQAFSTLGQTLVEGVFSSAALSAQNLADQIERIIRLQKDLREDRAAAFSPEVQRERAIQGSLERSKEERGFLGREKTLEELTAIEGRIAASRERERRAAEQAVTRARALEGQEERVGAALQLPEVLRLLQARPGAAPTKELREEARANAQRRAEQITALPPAEREAAIRELRQEVDDYLASVKRQFNLSQSSIDDIAGTFDSVLEQFRLVASEAADPLIEAFAKESVALRDRLARAGGTLEESIKAAIPGAAGLRRRLDELGEVIRRGNKAIEDSAKLPPDQQREARQNAISGVREAAKELDARLKEVAAIDIARQALDRFAEALNRASQEAQADLGQAQQRADQARREDLGFSTPATREARERADADLVRQRELATNVEEEVAAAKERLRQRVPEVQELRRRAELAQEAVRSGTEIRRRAAEAGIDANQVYQAIAADARAAGNNAFADLVESVGARQSEITRELSLPDGDEFWNGVYKAIADYEAIVNEAASEAERALSRIAEIDAQLGTQGVLAPGQREALVRERARLEQQAVEADEQVRRARDEAAAAAERVAAADRGRELSLSPGERAGRDLAKTLEDLRQNFIREGGGAPTREQARRFDADSRRLTGDAFRQAAPAIFGLADQVQNAILQGPSRAALQATDVSTVEGARELNRLLRGDDAARDQNLVELQKQSTILEDMLQELRQGNAQVAN